MWVAVRAGMVHESVGGSRRAPWVMGSWDEKLRHCASQSREVGQEGPEGMERHLQSEAGAWGRAPELTGMRDLGRGGGP